MSELDTSQLPPNPTAEGDLAEHDAAHATTEADKAFELPPYRKLAELNEEELAERQDIITFATTLARAILQSSYYSSDHPMARRTVQEPFAMVSKLGKKWQEFTFVKASWSDDQSMAMDSVFNEAIGLEELIGGTAGEHFSRKLHTFSERNRLVSFSIKNAITEDEFHRFVTVFVARHIDMEASRLLEQYEEDYTGPVFTEQLIEANVVNVTVVLESDLVQDKRRLPWRVKVALARLQKDLRNIPLYSKATETELRHAKVRLLRDIMRPLRKGVYLKQLFLNLDLISGTVREFEGVDMEPDMLSALPLGRLMKLGRALITERDRLNRPGLEDAAVFREDLDETIERQLRYVGGELADHIEYEGVIDLLRELFESRLVPLEALPYKMQQQIRMDRWTASFLVDPDGFLRLFDEIESPAAYISQLPNLVAIFPNLLRVKKFGEAQKINDLLARHRQSDGGFAGRRTLVETALGKLDADEVFRHLGVAMMEGSADTREYVRNLFVQMGTASIQPLVRVLDGSTRQDVCNDAAVALIALGDQATPHIREVLGDRHIRRVMARFLIQVLGELEDTGSTELIHQYTRHPHPLVRDAALSALVKIHGDKAEPLLVRSLNDKSPEIVTRVIRLLVRMNSQHKGYLFRLLQFIGAVDVEGQDVGDVPMTVHISAIQALASMGNLSLGDLGTLEDQFINGLGGGASSKMMGFLNRGKTSAEDAIRVALCDALVLVGGEKSLERLSHTAYEPSPLVRQRMEQSIVKLEKRLQRESADEATDTDAS